MKMRSFEDCGTSLRQESPCGIRPVVSREEGLTRDAKHPIALCTDGAGYDLGDPVRMVLADQTIVTLYYLVQPAESVILPGRAGWCNPPSSRDTVVNVNATGPASPHLVPA